MSTPVMWASVFAMFLFAMAVLASRGDLDHVHASPAGSASPGSLRARVCLFCVPVILYGGAALPLGTRLVALSPFGVLLIYPDCSCFRPQFFILVVIAASLYHQTVPTYERLVNVTGSVSELRMESVLGTVTSELEAIKKTLQDDWQRVRAAPERALSKAKEVRDEIQDVPQRTLAKAQDLREEIQHTMDSARSGWRERHSHAEPPRERHSAKPPAEPLAGSELEGEVRERRDGPATGPARQGDALPGSTSPFAAAFEEVSPESLGVVLCVAFVAAAIPEAV